MIVRSTVRKAVVMMGVVERDEQKLLGFYYASFAESIL